MPLKPGAKTIAEPPHSDGENPIKDTGVDPTFEDSMAAAMESAFMSQWSKFNPDIDPPTGFGLEGLRLMFIAISQGMVSHLDSQSSSLKVQTSVNVSTVSDTSPGAGTHSHTGTGAGTGTGTVNSIDTDP